MSAPTGCPSLWPQRWDCPQCSYRFRARPYDIGSGPEVSCPQCEWCWGAEGQPLTPLDLDKLASVVSEALEHRARRLGHS